MVVEFSCRRKVLCCNQEEATLCTLGPRRCQDLLKNVGLRPFGPGDLLECI